MPTTKSKKKDGPRTGRPPASAEAGMWARIGIRVSRTINDRITAALSTLQKQVPGASRAAAIRALLILGLEASEARARALAEVPPEKNTAAQQD